MEASLPPTHTLHLTDADLREIPEVTKIRAVREAMRILRGNDSLKAHDANNLMQEAREEGYALLGEDADLQLLSNVAGALATNGMEALIDYTPEDEAMEALEEIAQRPEDPDESDDAANLIPPPAVADNDKREPYSMQAYETALACLGNAAGKPLDAAFHAHSLGRASDRMEFYMEVVNVLIRIYPWIATHLLEGGLIKKP